MAESKHRGHHEGSIYYVAERDRWVAEISLDLASAKSSIARPNKKRFARKTKRCVNVSRGS